MLLPEAKIVDQRNFSVFTYSLRDDGILYIHTASDEYDIEKIKAGVTIIGEMTKGKAVPLLITHAKAVIPPVEARKFWAKKDSCPYSKAEAFMIGSTAQALIGNFYMSFNKPARPTRLFTNEADAVQWLLKFKKT